MKNAISSNTEPARYNYIDWLTLGRIFLLRMSIRGSWIVQKFSLVKLQTAKFMHLVKVNTASWANLIKKTVFANPDCRFA